MSVEDLLSAGHDVSLPRRDAYEVLQKLRARGGESETAAKLESRMAETDADVPLARAEAEQLLDELKASGRRWISGTDAPRPEPPRKEPEPEPEPQSDRKRRWFRRRG
jgi:hypothetical protein